MKVLFADYDTPTRHAAKEVSVTNSRARERRWWDVLIEQLINSAIVAGIAGLTAADLGVAWKAFGLTFLIEMRKYRKL